MFAISTAWCSGTSRTGEELLSRLSQTGLQHIEIDYRVTAEMLQQMRPFLQRGEFVPLSLHNYCPLPEGYAKDQANNLFQPSSLDADERKLAIRYSIQSLQWAAELGVKAVVFHLGQVDMAHETKELFELYHHGQAASTQADEWREKKLAQRGALATPYVSALLQTLDPVHEEACRLSVYIGAENRYRYSEIPFGDEFDLLFTEFNGGNLRYWHDAGHAELNHRLGFLHHERDLLARHQERLLGFHLHDILQLQDHKAPGQGDLDFNIFKPYVSDRTINILEVHHPATAQDIRRAVLYLQELGF
jgi:sugar phosphate isomerase/epimerase